MVDSIVASFPMIPAPLNSYKIGQPIEKLSGHILLLSVMLYTKPILSNFYNVILICVRNYLRNVQDQPKHLSGE
jgi:hypothetical protein